MSADAGLSTRSTGAGTRIAAGSIRRTTRRSGWRALAAEPGVLVAAMVLAALALAATLAPVLAPFDPADQSLLMRNQPPGAIDAETGGLHPLGTDHLGRDVLSRLLYGARVSLAVAAATLLVSGTVGTVLGLLAGYRGGALDDVLMRLVDLQMGFPTLLLALLVLYVVGPGPANVVLVLAAARWMVYARVVRATVLQQKQQPYVEAARAAGCDDRRIVLAHLLPNVLPRVFLLATLEASSVILLEASLGFLGLGLPLGTPSWGGMLAQGREYVTSAWWLVTFPGLAILLTTSALNVLAGRARRG